MTTARSQGQELRVQDGLRNVKSCETLCVVQRMWCVRSRRDRRQRAAASSSLMQQCSSQAFWLIFGLVGWFCFWQERRNKCKSNCDFIKICCAIGFKLLRLLIVSQTLQQLGFRKLSCHLIRAATNLLCMEITAGGTK